MERQKIEQAEQRRIDIRKEQEFTAQREGVRRRSRKKPAKKRSPFFWILIIALVIAGILVVKAVGEYISLQNEKQQLEIQVKEMKAKQAALEEEKERLKKPEVIEGIARDELGLVKPGEVPYVK